MENKNKEIVLSENSPADMIKIAVQGGADLGKLEQLLTLQERWEANQAKKAYHKAMSDFKANPPRIDKDKDVAYGNTKYSHASLANVTEKISTELSKHGLSASWSTKQNGAILVTCRITHVQGHSEETTLSAPSDTSGSKNAIQAIGSTITYLERYTLLALTGLATYDQDDDGQAAGGPIEHITPEQVSIILDNLADLNMGIEGFLKFMKTPSLELMLKSDYQKAMEAIKAKREAREAKKKEAKK